MAVPDRLLSIAELRSKYQALLDITLQMQTLARAEDWDALAGLLPMQERIMAEMPDLLAAVPLGESADEMAVLLSGIDIANQEVIYRISTRQTEIKQIAGEVSTAKNNVNRLGRAYRH